MIDVLLWFLTPNNFEFEVKSISAKLIEKKSFVEIETTPFDFYFYNIDKFEFNYKLTRKKWISFRGFIDDESSTFVYLFNEGDFNYFLEEGDCLGKLKAKKISFIELWKKIWKK
jgi:hypothetical protein